jgi:hypothetical protein
VERRKRCRESQLKLALHIYNGVDCLDLLEAIRRIGLLVSGTGQHITHVSDMCCPLGEETHAL